MIRKYARAIWFTLGATAICVVFSVVATSLVLRMTGTDDPPVAYLLAVLLPAVCAPASILPLHILLERLRRMSRQLERLALTDPLTGMPNRRAFFESAGDILSGATSQAPVAAMMIDVDRFKSVNDEFGHGGGDALLRAIGTAIVDAVANTHAPKSMVARLGGEEFAVLVAGLVPSAVARLADRICIAARQATVRVADREVSSTVSCGVALQSAPRDIDLLLKAADDAVYLAKRGGRDRWAFAAGEVTAPDPTRASLVRVAERTAGAQHATAG